MSENRKWALAWTKFESFRDHLPDSLDENVVSQFHDILSQLEAASGEDLSSFRIPDHQMKQRVVAFSFPSRRRPGSQTLSAKKYCDEKFLRQQLDGIARYMDAIATRREVKPDNKQTDYWSMSDSELERIAHKYKIPPISRTGPKLEHWYIDRDRIIEALLKRDRALREGEPVAPTTASNVIHVEGSLYGSSIQQATDQSSSMIDYRSQGEELSGLLKQIRESLDELSLSKAARAELEVDTYTIEAQLASPNPKPSIIFESLHSLKTIIENAAGSLVASALLPQITKMLGG